MNPETLEQLLTLAVFDQLSEDQRHQLEAHLATHPDDQHRLDDMRQATDLLTQAITTDDASSLTNDRREKVLSVTPKVIVRRDRSWWSGTRWLEIAVVLGICALLIGLMLPALGGARRTSRQMRGSDNQSWEPTPMVLPSAAARKPQGLGDVRRQADSTIKKQNVQSFSNIKGTMSDKRMAMGEREEQINPNIQALLGVARGDISGNGIVSRDKRELNRKLPDMDFATGNGGKVPTSRMIGQSNGQVKTDWRGSIVYADNHVVMEKQTVSDALNKNNPNQSEQAIYSDRYHSELDALWTQPTGLNQTDWRGNVRWNDNHVITKRDPILDTRYNRTINPDDNLFQKTIPQAESKSEPRVAMSTRFAQAAEEVDTRFEDVDTRFRDTAISNGNSIRHLWTQQNPKATPSKIPKAKVEFSGHVSNPDILMAMNGALSAEKKPDPKSTITFIDGHNGNITSATPKSINKPSGRDVFRAGKNTTVMTTTRGTEVVMKNERMAFPPVVTETTKQDRNTPTDIIVNTKPAYKGFGVVQFDSGNMIFKDGHVEGETIHDWLKQRSKAEPATIDAEKRIMDCASRKDSNATNSTQKSPTPSKPALGASSESKEFAKFQRKQKSLQKILDNNTTFMIDTKKLSVLDESMKEQDRETKNAPAGEVPTVRVDMKQKRSAIDALFSLDAAENQDSDGNDTANPGANSTTDRKKILADVDLRMSDTKVIAGLIDAKDTFNQPSHPNTGITANGLPLDEASKEQNEEEYKLPPAAAFKAGPVNPFVMAGKDRLSTFALDVDTASYTLARQFINKGYLPPSAAVRMEEFINNFNYNYSARSDRAFAVHSQAAASPFGKDLVLLKVGVKGRVVGRDGRKAANLVFVIDTSGSMATNNRLPMVQYGLKLLVSQLNANDRVSIVTYGVKASLILDGVPGDKIKQISQSVSNLQCQGSTNLMDGLQLGYEVAKRHHRAGQINRVMLLSDGVANIGVTEADQMIKRVESFRHHGITLTSVGFGDGSYNDALMEKLSNRGDGAYVFVDSKAQAKLVFHDNMMATLQTIARDAKIQVKFDPARVRRYRLIGYENRAIADADFRNDTVDAGEVGSGQSSTALYELELVGDDNDLGAVYVRYHDADDGQVREISHRLTTALVQKRTPANSPRYFLAACAAEFAELLRQSEHAAGGSIDQLEPIMTKVCEQLPLDSQAKELLGLIRRAKGLPTAP